MRNTKKYKTIINIGIVLIIFGGIIILASLSFKFGELFGMALILVGVIIAFSAENKVKKLEAEAIERASVEIRRRNAELEKNKVKKIKSYPKKVDNCGLIYSYNFEIVPAYGVNIEKDILKGEEKIVEIDADEENIFLIENCTVFATINNPNKARMVMDFKKRNEPCHAILLADAKSANLRFYRNKKKALSNKRNTVVKLKSYKSLEKQETIEFIEKDEELDFDVDIVEEKIVVEYEGNEIGKLPREIEKRVFDDGCEIKAIFFEKNEEEETEEYDTIYAPFVRIYWDD